MVSPNQKNSKGYFLESGVSPLVCRIDRDEVLATVVLFYPSEACLINLEALAANRVAVLLIDNTPEEHPLRSRLLSLVGPRFRFIEFKENLGISVALNHAGQTARIEGFSWLLTLDQDSRVSYDYVESMNSVLSTVPHPETVGILAPSLTPGPPGAPPWQSVTLAITSGALMRVELFEQVGWFDESLFIDYVDFDYCAKTTLAGYRVIIATNIILQHEIGEPSHLDLPFWSIRTLNHPPIRRYYKFRNRIAMIRRYGFQFPAWIFRDMLSALLEPMKILILEKNSWNKIRMVLWGTWDGLRGQFGPAPTGRRKND
jgi:rhamnosyltransferase